ncbi:MAG: DegT/DnrJ/EryC1/StrS family aminotransferase [Candidatus Hydrogenedentota bacterium]
MIHRKPSVAYTEFLGRQPILDETPRKFAYGRTALKYGLQALGLGQGAEILVPEMTCRSLLVPLREKGMNAVYYRIRRDFTPDWEHLESAATSDTKALIMIHYFGIPQDIDRFQAFCRARSIFLVEDNAHGYGGRRYELLLGRFGDIGFSTPRKTFGVVNGAYLYARDGLVLPKTALSGLEPMNLIREQMRFHKRRFLEQSNWLRRKFLPPLPYDSQDHFRDTVRRDWNMDIKTDQFLERQDLDDAARRRRELYGIWREWAERQDIEPVHREIDGTCAPMVFPAWTRSADESRAWFDWGYRNEIDVHSWPTLPRELVERGSDALENWKRTVCFPIHQEIDPAALRARIGSLS